MVQERMDVAPLRLALIGCGQIGRLHARRIAVDGRAKIVALCDPSVENARALQTAFAPEAIVAGEVDALPAAMRFDAAIVCTPTHHHFEQVRALRAAGIPVLCEKPLADTRERIVELIDDVERGGPLLSIAYQRRYGAVFRTLRREVLSARYGPVRSVNVHNAERWQQTIAGTWRDDPQQNPGGFIGDAGSHKIDMVFFVTGLAPVEVFAQSDRRGSRVEIVTTVAARLESDVALSMNFIGNAQHYREDFHVHCAEADLLMRDEAVWIARDNRVEKLEPLEPGSDPNAGFVDCLRGEGSNAAPARVALPVWDFTQAILESARTGVVVRL